MEIAPDWFSPTVWSVRFTHPSGGTPYVQNLSLLLMIWAVSFNISADWPPNLPLTPLCTERVRYRNATWNLVNRLLTYWRWFCRLCISRVRKIYCGSFLQFRFLVYSFLFFFGSCFFSLVESDIFQIQAFFSKQLHDSQLSSKIPLFFTVAVLMWI